MIAEMERLLGSHHIVQDFHPKDGRRMLLHQEHLWSRERGLIQTVELSTVLTAYGNRDKSSSKQFSLKFLARREI